MASKKLIDINIPVLLNIIAEKKKAIATCFFVTAVVAVIVSFSIPRIYKSNVTLAPESSIAGGFTNFSSLAEMVGINLNFTNSGDAIYPEIYPDLIRSNDFLVSLFDVEVVSQDSTIRTTYYDYIQNRQKAPWWTLPIGWINVLLPKDDDGSQQHGNAPDPFMLTKEQDDVVKAISANIKCGVDKKTNVISIEVTAQDPLIAATMTEVVRKQLQVFITNYRTNKARMDMEYISGLCDEAFTNYEKSRREYSLFSDANQKIFLPSVNMKREALENEMTLKYDVYKQLAEQLEITKAKLQERTPAFTIVQMATVPLKHSNTKKIVILFVFEVLALGTYLLIIAYKNRKKLFTFSWQN